MFVISATRKSSFVKSSNCIVAIPSIISLGTSSLLRFGFAVSILAKRIGAFFMSSVLNMSCIFSADSGMKGESSLAISLILSTNW